MNIPPQSSPRKLKTGIATAWLRKHDRQRMKFEKKKAAWKAAKDIKQAKRNPALVASRAKALGLR